MNGGWSCIPKKGLRTWDSWDNAFLEFSSCFENISFVYVFFLAGKVVFAAIAFPAQCSLSAFCPQEGGTEPGIPDVQRKVALALASTDGA